MEDIGGGTTTHQRNNTVAPILTKLCGSLAVLSIVFLLCNEIESEWRTMKMN